MSTSSKSDSLLHCVEALQQDAVIAYPTEAVFGLGCDPDSEKAVNTLLAIKKRPAEKGLILIAASYSQLLPYIRDELLTAEQRQRMFSHWPGPVTFVVPSDAPHWLRGKFDTLAVRVSDHPDVQQLCQAFGKPLVSTSANLSGQEPCRNTQEVVAQFGIDFPVLEGLTGGRTNPSEIRNVITGELIRQG
ncbi:L-threonylcarbamoyladenylate synthase type 1 TsaC [Tatumella saanichensis]|uniref:L-threonylcarbamoyladenylate synthase type 1 TsaC n=1 Tax=Tatumella saanichensis TaxID=480813 RepID=UPI0004A3A725|nr:L-threonylcarbamoyladenylate synthase type 1 TsaC [Tatumella saanichensis]